jgi:hypothetical protein
VHRYLYPPRVALGAAIAFVIVTATGCQPAIAGLRFPDGSGPTKVQDLFGALAVRFGVAYRDQRFEAIRPRMVRHALTPSRIYHDTTLWTSFEGDVHTVTVAGELVGDRYVLSARPSVPRPDAPGKSRHSMHLRRISESVHQWDSTDELAVGTVRAADVFSILEGAMRGLERSSDAVRSDYRAAFPKTTMTLGRLFTLDTVRTISGEHGSTVVSIASRLDANRLRPTAPKYAAYIDEYLKPLRIEVMLTDTKGTNWGTAQFRRNLLELHMRTRDGRLLPLSAADAAVPDSLQLRITFFAKVLFFDVGTTNLVADVISIRAVGPVDGEDASAGGDARGWSLRFRREPQWHFPLAVSRLLRAPLRRPFADGGTVLEYVVHDTTGGGQTLLARNIHIVVQESAIVRWLGALGATAMGDLTTEAEQEKDRFVGEVFRAVGEDLRVLLPH